MERNSQSGLKNGRDPLKTLLDKLADQFNQVEFIADDPISIPHRFTRKQDIEIMGLWIALLSWGNRKTILQSGEKLIHLMDGRPYEFVLHHEEVERKRFDRFVHRTFNGEDAAFFLEFFQQYYQHHDSLEDAFSSGLAPDDPHVGPALIHFRALFVELANPPGRTLKHISSPESGSRCKRLLLFLRWMVRSDGRGVDFGLWEKIKPRQLLMPLDVHVEKTARMLGLLERKQTDWKAVLQLTERCSKLHPADPVLYDFALFGLGLIEKQGLLNNSYESYRRNEISL
jgi:uncharacterized protein (TIGR02757 family)